jgi:L-ornithine N5-oxygenase
MASLRRPEADSLLDLLCVGFGPASLAVAVALHDAIASPTAPPGLQHLRYQAPKVAFLERQEQFRWHAGMLLPGAKMQISFIKDLATLRDPRSEFTFLNYLHKNRRLVPFTNLGTFFPLRSEYEDYMRWCAEKFDDLVHYGQHVYEITPGHVRQDAPAVEAFVVRSRDVKTNRLFTWRARHVVVAVGGSPRVPAPFPPAHPRVVHSSQYLHAVPKLLQDRDARHRVAVIGGGQSAAEIFNDLRSRFPNSKTWLIIAGAALKPSDDSPL